MADNLDRALEVLVADRAHRRWSAVAHAEDIWVALRAEVALDQFDGGADRRCGPVRRPVLERRLV